MIPDHKHVKLPLSGAIANVGLNCSEETLEALDKAAKLAMVHFETICNTRDKVRMGKIMYKLPMSRKVVTEAGEVWEYIFADRKIIWRYRYSVRFE